VEKVREQVENNQLIEKKERKKEGERVDRCIKRAGKFVFSREEDKENRRACLYMFKFICIDVILLWGSNNVLMLLTCMYIVHMYIN